MDQNTPSLTPDASPDATPGALRMRFTLAQGNTILEGLAELPFKQVFSLIGELNRQAQIGFAADSQADDVAEFALDSAHLRLILATLGEMPFKRVQPLLHSMHQQMQASLR
jgi:hypothetical protein